MKRRLIDSPWALASLVFALLAVAALFLLRGSGGPHLPGGGAPTATPALWSLPDWMLLACVVVLLLALPAAAICAVVACARRRKASLPAVFFWGGGLLLAVLSVLCFV